MKKIVMKTYEDPLIDVVKISRRLKALRIQRGYTTVEAFTKETGLSRSQYLRFEKGNDLKLSSLVKIIKAFNITFSEFFEDGFL
jgi:transcriptional regulator with XRE-family HTH domain